MHIIAYHFFRDSDDAPATDHVFSDLWNRFAGWGGSQLTLFYLLSGFVLAYQYADRTVEAPARFWFKRFARLYPMYLVTIILMLAQLRRERVYDSRSCNCCNVPPSMDTSSTQRR